MTKTSGYYDLRQAFGEPGCPVCRLLVRNADRYVETVLWEMVTDVDAREKFRQTQGYCREHAWLLARRGASLGTAILMLDVLEQAMRVLEADRPDQRPSFSQQLRQKFNRSQPDEAAVGLAAELAAQHPCPVCLHLRQTEAYLLTALVEHLTGPDSLVPAYRASDGLCLPHLRLVLSRLPDGAALENLVRAQLDAWQRLRTELREFIRKSDFNVKEQFGQEGDAWIRAIEAISGAPPARVKD
jgi:hypothetical protein